jgi:hypothetical protein
LSKKVTTADFIERAIAVHGDAYDYSETEYIKGHLKVTVRCIKHDHIFQISPCNHTSGKQGCPICRYEKSSDKGRKPLSTFVKEAEQVHGERFDYSFVEYKNSSTKIKIRCIEHNLTFEQIPSDHLYGKIGCKVCQSNHRSSIQRDTKDSFVAKSTAKFYDKFDYSLVDYVTAKVKVKLVCNSHGIVFEITPDSHLSGNSKGGCPECSREVMGQYHRMSVEDFITRASEKHSNFYDYSRLVLPKNMHEKVEIICPQHGSFHQTPTNHLHNGFGCSVCAAIERGLAFRLTQEEVIERFIERHGDKYDYSKVKYSMIYEPVTIYCKEHGVFFEQIPCNHFVGSGCKKCVDKGYSRDKSGYFYINKVSDNVALKVGITNVCPIERAKVLNRKSDTHEITNLFYFYHEDGDFIYKLEGEILKRFETGIVPKSEMSSGYTETVDCSHLPEIIDIVTLRFNQYPNVYLKPD